MYLTPPVLLMASTSELRRCKDKKINGTKKEIFIEISEISTKWLWTRAQRCPPLVPDFTFQLFENISLHYKVKNGYHRVCFYQNDCI